MDTITVSLVNWKENQSNIYCVRKSVFVDEQKVPPEIELDDKDPLCKHVLVFNADKPIGTGRIDNQGKIGRMAVLPEYRKKGIGRTILNALLQYGRENNIHNFHLSAQLHAVGFYEESGFRRYGDEYIEAGIMHVMMCLKESVISNTPNCSP